MVKRHHSIERYQYQYFRVKIIFSLNITVRHSNKYEFQMVLRNYNVITLELLRGIYNIQDNLGNI